MAAEKPRRAPAAFALQQPASPQMAEDIDQAPVFLRKTAWEINSVAERYPKVSFLKTKERGEGARPALSALS